jgi:hypothetical protein
MRMIAMLILAAALSLTGGRTVHAGITPPPGGQSGIGASYHIEGDGSVGFTYTSPAGQQDRADCHMSYMPRWWFKFDGTVDTFTQTMKGTISAPPEYGDLANPDKWRQDDLQCGPNQGTYIQYSYAYVATDGTFSGSYSPSSDTKYHGSFHLLGHVTLTGGYQLTLCTQPAKLIDCHTVYPGLTAANATPIPNFVGFNFANKAVEVEGNFDFIPSDTGKGDLWMHMYGKLSLPDSEWGACCLKHNGSDGAWEDAIIDGRSQ